MWNNLPPDGMPQQPQPAKTIHVIGLDREGQNLCDLLEGIGVNATVRRISQATVPLTDVQYVYIELISQILLGLTDNEFEFLEHLKTVPDFRYFEHIEIVRDPVYRQTISDAAKKFGLDLFFRIARTIRLSPTSSYLIEQATRSVVVIAECPKGEVFNA
jgi:hypothetical protein